MTDEEQERREIDVLRLGWRTGPGPLVGARPCRLNDNVLESAATALHRFIGRQYRHQAARVGGSEGRPTIYHCHDRQSQSEHVKL